MSCFHTNSLAIFFNIFFFFIIRNLIQVCLLVTKPDNANRSCAFFLEIFRYVTLLNYLCLCLFIISWIYNVAIFKFLELFILFYISHTYMQKHYRRFIIGLSISHWASKLCQWDKIFLQTLLSQLDIQAAEYIRKPHLPKRAM